MTLAHADLFTFVHWLSVVRPALSLLLQLNHEHPAEREYKKRRPKAPEEGKKQLQEVQVSGGKPILHGSSDPVLRALHLHSHADQ